MVRARLLLEAAYALLDELAFLAPSKELEQILQEVREARLEMLYNTRSEEVTDRQVAEYLCDAAVLLLQAGLGRLAFRVLEGSKR